MKEIEEHDGVSASEYRLLDGVGKPSTGEFSDMPKPARPYLELGRNLFAARQKEGWTQEQAAERAGVSLKYWQALEAGRKAPAFSTLCRLRASLKIAWNDLCRSC